MPQPSPYSEYTSVVGLNPTPTATPTWAMSLPVSRPKLSPQDLAIEEHFKQMRQKNADTPMQRWAARTALGPLINAKEAIQEYYNFVLPRKPVDWVILAATEGLPQAQSVARLVDKLGGPLKKLLKFAPEEIREVADMHLTTEDLDNLNKVHSMPRELMDQLAQREEEKFLGMSPREIEDYNRKTALREPGGETMVGPKGEIYTRPGEGGGLAPKPPGEVTVRPQGEVAVPGREVATTGKGGPAAARPAGGAVGPHVAEPVEVTRGPRSPENKPLDMGTEAEMVVPEDIDPNRHIPRPYRGPLRKTARWLAKGRLSAPIRGATGGYLYDVITGQDPSQGAKQGLYAGLVSTAVGTAGEELQAHFGQKGLVNEGIREYGRALRKSVPEAKPLNNADDIHRLHVSGELENHYGERTRKVQQAVVNEMKGRKFMIPLPTLPGEGAQGQQAAAMTLDAAFQLANSEEQQARYEAGMPGPMNVREHRINAAKILTAIQEQLNDPQIGYPGFGDYVMQTRKDYGGAIELGKAARTPGLFDGRLFDWPKFQGLLATKYYRTLQSMFGPEAADRIVRGSRRGADLSKGSDVKGPDTQGTYMIGGLIPVPHLSRYHAVGDPGFWVNNARAAAVSKYLNWYPSDDKSNMGIADPTVVAPNLPSPPAQLPPVAPPTPAASGNRGRLKLTPVP